MDYSTSTTPSCHRLKEPRSVGNASEELLGGRYEEIKGPNEANVHDMGYCGRRLQQTRRDWLILSDCFFTGGATALSERIPFDDFTSNLVRVYMTYLWAGEAARKIGKSVFPYMQKNQILMFLCRTAAIWRGSSWRLCPLYKACISRQRQRQVRLPSADRAASYKIGRMIQRLSREPLHRDRSGYSPLQCGERPGPGVASRYARGKNVTQGLASPVRTIRSAHVAQVRQGQEPSLPAPNVLSAREVERKQG